MASPQDPFYYLYMPTPLCMGREHWSEAWKDLEGMGVDSVWELTAWERRKKKAAASALDHKPLTMKRGEAVILPFSALLPMPIPLSFW